MNKKYFEKLGELLKDARIDKLVTQQELANKLKVTRNCIANWETGRRKIDIIEYQKLCKALDINHDELLKKVDKYVN